MLLSSVELLLEAAAGAVSFGSHAWLTRHTSGGKESMLRKSMVAVAVALGGTFLMGGVAAADTYGPVDVSVSASDGQVTQNETVTYEGSGFEPGEQVTVVVTAPDGTTQNIVLTAGADGRVISPITFTGTGSYTVTSTGNSGRTVTTPVISANGTATGTIDLPEGSDDGFVAGEEQTFTFGGLPPNQHVIVTLFSNPYVIAEGDTDANGNLTVTGTIPADIAAGAHTLRAISEDGTLAEVGIVVVVGDDGTTTTVTPTDTPTTDVPTTDAPTTSVDPGPGDPGDPTDIPTSGVAIANGNVIVGVNDGVIIVNNGVIIAGNGYFKNEPITITAYQYGTNGAVNSIVVTADEDGGWSWDWTPSSAGTIVYEAVGQWSGYKGSTKVVVEGSEGYDSGYYTAGTTTAYYAADAGSTGSGSLASTGASIGAPLAIGGAALAGGLALLFFGTRGAIRRRGGHAQQ
jgi:hypothetical protein